jgi:hypothetical protein
VTLSYCCSCSILLISLYDVVLSILEAKSVCSEGTKAYSYSLSRNSRRQDSNWDMVSSKSQEIQSVSSDHHYCNYAPIYKLEVSPRALCFLTILRIDITIEVI